MTQRETFLTPDGLKQLQKELETLKSVRRREVAARIHRASETGGTADNAEYDEAKSEQAFVEGRIQDLESIISKATVTPVRKRGKKSDTVEFGSTVTVTTPQGKKQKYIVVGSAEAAPLEGKISNESPVGKAILGQKVGAKVEVQTPSGSMKLTISEIR